MTRGRETQTSFMYGTDELIVDRDPSRQYDRTVVMDNDGNRLWSSLESFTDAQVMVIERIRRSATAHGERVGAALLRAEFRRLLEVPHAE